jgi:hypothetical protein
LILISVRGIAILLATSPLARFPPLARECESVVKREHPVVAGAFELTGRMTSST